jgi:hypothetical protein
MSVVMSVDFDFEAVLAYQHNLMVMAEAATNLIQEQL